MLEQKLIPFRRPLVDWNKAMKESGCQKENDLSRMYRLKRYFSPQIAEIVLKCPDGDSLWESHRQEVTVVVLDLRGFTKFANSAEPEEVMALLRNYHAEMGRLVFKFDGTLERSAARVGDDLVEERVGVELDDLQSCRADGGIERAVE